MGIIKTLRKWFNSFFKSKAKEVFDVKSQESAEMAHFIEMCSSIYRGVPDWLEEDVKSFKFAKTICEEYGKLAMLGTSIKVDGSTRGNWLQKQVDSVYFKLRQWVEYATAYGTIVLKPNGETIDVVLPNHFMITEESNGVIKGIVFHNSDVSRDGKTFYTRLEYHRFINNIYYITNRCFAGISENDLSKEIHIEESPWSNLKDEMYIANIENPLYAVLKTPVANSIDINSCMGMPMFAQAIDELQDLDVALSRRSEEIYDSQRTTLLDSDRLPIIGENLKLATLAPEKAWENVKKKIKLPRFIRNVEGGQGKDFFEDITPELHTAERNEGINALLSQIGFKCGFSNGYFVFNEKTGMITATQVESDDRRTIGTIKDIRDCLESALNDLIYALDKFADLYGLAPQGLYEVCYSFGDITYSQEEDKATWWKYVMAGKVPAWMYFVKFEGMTEDEAKAMQLEMDETSALFSAE
jgi:A118 family predicted phage portal protein